MSNTSVIIVFEYEYATLKLKANNSKQVKTTDLKTFDILNTYNYFHVLFDEIKQILFFFLSAHLINVW